MRLIEILENRKEALKVSEVAKILGVIKKEIEQSNQARNGSNKGNGMNYSI